MPTKTLEDMFVERLKDMYQAERKILEALTRLAKGAMSSSLTATLEDHRNQTEQHVNRLQQVFDLIKRPDHGKDDPAPSDRVAEPPAGQGPAVLAPEQQDAARYDTLCHWAVMLNLPEAAALLQQNLAEDELPREACLPPIERMSEAPAGGRRAGFVRPPVAPRIAGRLSL